MQIACPSLFSQLYILVAWYKGKSISCAFVLQGGKKKVHIRMIKELKEAALVIKQEFRPKNTIVYFETGAI